MMYHRIAQQFYNRPLWLMPSAAETISAFLLTRMRAGARPLESDSGSTVQAFPAKRREDGSLELHSPRASRFHAEYRVGPDGRPSAYPITRDGTAIITVVGELVHRGAYVGASSGIVTYEGFTFQVRSAAKDPNVRAIVIDMESPGGEATGAFEAAAVVREAARVKPVWAVVNGLAASAGYALISGATRIVTMPTGVSGSIGVVLLHLDFSAQADALGVKPTFVFAGAHKVDGHPFATLPDDVRERMQASVDSYYEQFVETVAAGRRKLLSADAVRRTEARTFKGQDAVDVGLADTLGDLESVLAELARGPATGRRPTIAPTAIAAPVAAASAVAPIAAEPTSPARIADIRARVAGVQTAAPHPQPIMEKPFIMPNTPSTPEQWRAEYAAQDAKGASLRAEFPSVESWVSYSRAAAAGRIKILAPGLAAIGATSARQPAPAPATAPSPAPAADDEALRRTFNAQTPEGANLRGSFGGSFEAFAAYWKASQRKVVSFHGRGTVVSRGS